jgi:hypothetical protein
MTRVLGNAAVAVLVAAALAGPPAAAAPGKAKANGTGGCRVQGNAEVMRVDCVRSTVGRLLKALNAATGLRSEYPNEFRDLPVSLAMRNTSLHEVLTAGLASFNFALWLDPEGHGTQRLLLVSTRHLAPDGGPRALSVRREAEPRRTSAAHEMSVEVLPAMEASPAAIGMEMMTGSGGQSESMQ